jgi:hypothetical protein
MLQARTFYLLSTRWTAKGQCYVFAAHLYQTAQRQWASALVGALLYVKGGSIPQLVGNLAQQVRLPALVRQVWVGSTGASPVVP